MTARTASRKIEAPASTRERGGLSKMPKGALDLPRSLGSYNVDIKGRCDSQNPLCRIGVTFPTRSSGPGQLMPSDHRQVSVAPACWVSMEPCEVHILGITQDSGLRGCVQEHNNGFALITILNNSILLYSELSNHEQSHCYCPEDYIHHVQVP